MVVDSSNPLQSLNSISYSKTFSLYLNFFVEYIIVSAYYLARLLNRMNGLQLGHIPGQSSFFLI